MYEELSLEKRAKKAKIVSLVTKCKWDPNLW